MDAHKRKIERALERVRTVLHVNRHPQYPADVHHSYDDKYILSNFVTNTTLAAFLNTLELLGLDAAGLDTLLEWVKDRSVTLRFSGEERCVFDRKEKRKVEDPTTRSVEVKTSSGFKAKISDKVVTKVTEYFWFFDVEYSISAYRGNKPSEDPVVLQKRHAHARIKTSTETEPYPKVSEKPAITANITWLLQQLNEEKQFNFGIDRDAKDCHTPRRNSQTEAALRHTAEVANWGQRVEQYFTSHLFPIQQEHGLDLSALSAPNVFVPIIPLFEAVERRHKHREKKEAGKKGEASGSSSSMGLAAIDPASSPSKESVVLPLADVNAFLVEQRRSFAERFAALSKIFPDESSGTSEEKPHGPLISVAEAKLVVIGKHMKELKSAFDDGVECIEWMLRSQLIAAIGKEVTPAEFTEYMVFHNRKLFKKEYEPRPFCYAIRRPNHCPEGTLGVEMERDDGSMAEPVYTSCRCIESGSSRACMQFPIDAATNIRFSGNRFLHAYVGHQFSGQSGSRLSLVARARQFSSFILLVGKIQSATIFEPKQALIIKNKDDLKIPLMLEQIPTPKEFRDAIESLSPEQQRFAKAFRSMQLESTLFAVCVIQIKPQLEKVLNLPEDALTKEIALTEDLNELFIKYQIPSDLLSFDGEKPDSFSVKEKLEVVKKHVKAMQEMIESKKETELTERAQESLYQVMDTIHLQAAPAPAPVMSSMSMKMDATLDVPKRRVKKKGGLILGAGAAKRKSPRMAAAPPPPSARAAAPPGLSAPPPVPAPSSGSASVSVSAPAPPPPESSAPPEQTKAEEAKTPSLESSDNGVVEDGQIDFTKIPAEMDKRFEELDEDSALRPTIISPGTVWTKKEQKSLLAKPEQRSLMKEQQETERNSAFDLLDALSRSGVLTISSAELHVVLAATHCFDKTLLNTVIQDNVNPIEKVERSSLIIASSVHAKPAVELVKESEVERVRTFSPMLFTPSK